MRGHIDHEPLYGATYLPRKFKIAIAVPPCNDVDVFAHCVGYIAIIGEGGKLEGYNVTVGGGLGTTHGNTKTFPRLADVMGFCLPEQAVTVVEKVCLFISHRRCCFLAYSCIYICVCVCLFWTDFSNARFLSSSGTLGSALSAR